MHGIPVLHVRSRHRIQIPLQFKIGKQCFLISEFLTDSAESAHLIKQKTGSRLTVADNLFCLLLTDSLPVLPAGEHIDAGWGIFFIQ